MNLTDQVISDLFQGTKRCRWSPVWLQLLFHNSGSRFIIVNASTVEDKPCALAQGSMTVTQLTSSMKLTMTDINMIEQQTICQSDNHLWFQLRKGPVTASEFYCVYTSLEETLKHDSLVRTELILSKILSHRHHLATSALKQGAPDLRQLPLINLSTCLNR